jgi:ribonuclease Z
MQLTRRKMLKISGTTLGGGLLMASPLGSLASASSNAEGTEPSEKNTLYDTLPVFPSGEQLDANQMRITFLGTSCIPRLSQECNSVYVEVGSGDQFVFDCGTGVVAKYNAMGIPMSKMNKIFLTHLHADHMSDLTHIYGFGPAEDRKSPLYIWGPANSGFTYTDPQGNIRGPYNDGTRAFCENFRNFMRWHTESFSFGATSYANQDLPTRESWGLPVELVQVSDDLPDDGFAIYPIELDWTKTGEDPLTPDDNIAYYNPDTGVKITHFPAIHTRFGSISYKLEWNGMSMIFSGDTKPNKHILRHAGGVDVLIHEMVMPAWVWAEKNSGYLPGDDDWLIALNYATEVQNSSHTPQGAFGYILSQITPPPRLAVATHFQASDDTITSAMQSVRNHYPVGEITFAADLMVLNVSANQIIQRRAVVSPYAYYPETQPKDTNPSLYWQYQDPDLQTGHIPDAYAQIDIAEEVPAVDPDTNNVNYNTNGY